VQYVCSMLILVLYQYGLHCSSCSFSSYNLYSLVKQLNATGRPDENFSIEVNGPLLFTSNEDIQDVRLLSIFLQKGQLRSNICYHPQNLTSVEVHHWYGLYFTCQWLLWITIDFRSLFKLLILHVLEPCFLVLKVRNLTLDELEFASLRGFVQKVMIV